jgi:glutamate/tyrosine decarboxylase-like PLP-dependent enzyme
VVVVPTDDEGRVTGEALADTIGTVAGPLIVCLQAGEVHTGAFDAFAEAIPVAHEHGAWVHVDGAFGLWAAASASTRHLTAGIAEADSWATDAHKTLNVPYDSGVALVARGDAIRAVFGLHADYLVHGTADPMECTPELSRRARGFPVWAALRSLGRSGVERWRRAGATQHARPAAGANVEPGVNAVRSPGSRGSATRSRWRSQDQAPPRAPLCSPCAARLGLVLFRCPTGPSFFATTTPLAAPAPARPAAGVNCRADGGPFSATADRTGRVPWQRTRG